VTDFIYLYGFVPADASAPLNITGIAGGTVQLLDVGAVKAVTSLVPADVYDPAQLEPRMQDLTWVAEQGVAHEVVVAWFVDNAQILPAALFTMYSSTDALTEAVAERAELLSSELQRLRNKREWDVKISFNEKEVAQHAGMLSPRIAEVEKEIAAASPGKRYLLEKRRTDLLKHETRDAASRLANEVVEAVRAHAAEVRILPLPRTADDLPVIMHAAALTERTHETGLVRALGEQQLRLQRYGITVRFSGPWAPYRFTGEHERPAAQ
jgi:hypothetical protein